MIPEDLFSILENSVVSSAQYIAKFFADNLAIEMQYKHDESMVMNIDVHSQQIILEKLGGSLPIIAEEDPASHAWVNQKSDYFLADPLDGTASAKRFRGIQGGQVGFGPLTGLVLNNQLVAASFVSLPHSTLFSAQRGQGVRAEKLDLINKQQPQKFQNRKKLSPQMPATLRECGVLFFPGANGEVPIVGHLRKENVVENMYRFGGFASDCTRLAQGLEQIQIQFSAKPWDYSAALFTREVGYEVVCDPIGEAVRFDQWKIAAENPLITCPSHLVDQFLTIIRR